MVLQVLTDPGKVLHDGDAESLQFGPVADARLHQHLGGVDRAERQHNFGSRSNAVNVSVMGELHTGGPVAVKRHPGYQRITENGEVGSM